MKSKQNPKDKGYQTQGAELSGLVNAIGRNHTASIAELAKTKDAIDAINRSKAAMSVDKRAGFIFEEVVAGTFNAAARKAGDVKTTAMTGGRGGFGTDPRVDIRVERSGKVIAEAQAKCCRTPERTAVSIAKPKYAGTERIVPAGQGEPIQKMLSASANAKATSGNPRMRELGAARQEASTKVAERLEAGGHKSRPVSHKDAIKMAKGDTSKVSQMIAVETITSAATSGAKSGAAFSGCVSAFASTSKVLKGEMSVKDAAKTIAKDTVVGGARSAATAVVAEGVKSVAKSSLSKAAAASVLRGAGPLAVAGCVVDVVSDACKGELTAKTAAKSVTRAAGGWAGAEGGAALGTLICPGVGTVVGGILGGVCGSLVGGSW